ncbi:MAG: bifunctional glutamate N-acetyltransferase/amino-acid acetyltransferase ArgJ [Gammaproteobacteria bacterium AqS3]|nr:bifunctional glutamate N-acetyltransferase/amino-acid acetyltransferase ArgJ [Gammaproteobacteria bacterium AqS3]
MAVGAAISDPPLPVAGISLAAVAAEIRYRDRLDLGLLCARGPCTLAATFTQNRFAAAPVRRCRELLIDAAPGDWALLVNAGNANAATGPSGASAALQTCRIAAAALGLPPERVLPFSTGVIGEALPVEPFAEHLGPLSAGLGEHGWEDFSRCILTTDTRPKVASRRLEFGAGAVTVTAVAKGAAMMQPDMATMLAFAGTDARIEQRLLLRLHREAVAGSFNRISIDGDTSTNDAAVLIATGAGGVEIAEGSPEHSALAGALGEVYAQLAREMVRDAEGAEHCVTLIVQGGRDAAQCALVGYAVANSPLFKTAVFAADPNWGRLAMAIGRSGADFDPDQVRIDFEDVPVMLGGVVAPDYSEAAATAVMARPEYTLRIDLGCGAAAERFWFSDLSHDYIRINADYRT